MISSSSASIKALETQSKATLQKQPLTVLVVGQVPPPVNGQSLMIQAFLQGNYEDIKLVHVPMRFSRSTAEIGSFNIRKILVLAATLVEIILTRFSSGASILYYPPAGANLTPVLRDLFLLIPTRFLFRYTAFHFHAAGLFGIYSRLPTILRPLFRIAYDRPDLAIFTTAATSTEAAQLRARKSVIIPCGIPDNSSATLTYAPKKIPSILFAGILCEEKGVLVLLEACRRLLAAEVPFRLTCIGAFQPVELRERVQLTLSETGLDQIVQFPGVITGTQKDELFAEADLFCFPSYYPAESFGVVLIEAMSFSLPIVATDWQGIPEVVGQCENKSNPPGALLVPPRDPEALAQALEQLLLSPQRRIDMGAHNRTRYLTHFTLANYQNRLEVALTALSTDPVNSDRHQKVSGSFGVHAQRSVQKIRPEMRENPATNPGP